MFLKNRDLKPDQPHPYPVHMGDGFDVFQDASGFYVLNADGARHDFASKEDAMKFAADTIHLPKPAA